MVENKVKNLQVQIYGKIGEKSLHLFLGLLYDLKMYYCLQKRDCHAKDSVSEKHSQKVAKPVQIMVNPVNCLPSQIQNQGTKRLY